MRCQCRLFFVLAILLSVLTLFPSPIAASRLHNPPLSPALPFQTPRLRQQSSDGRHLLTKFRDRIIRIIWGIPLNQYSKGSSHTQALLTDDSPPSFLAQYDGDVALRFRISNVEEAKALAEAANVLFLDVWEFTAEWADIRLAKDVVPSLLGLLPSSLQDAHSPLMHDLAQTVYDSYPTPAAADSPPSPHDTRRTFSPLLNSPPDETNIFFKEYQPLSVIVPWMKLMGSLFPTHVRLINIGSSYEGRDILALRVGVRPTNSERPSDPRKTIIIAGGSHAREWISTSTINYVAYSMITAYGKSTEMTKLLEEFDWVFIPTLNPDGYLYTWQNDRLWRKNRQHTNLRFCKGVDLDRSFSFAWDGEITSSNPCSESFSGDSPFQGVESRRFATWVKNETFNNNVDFVGFLDLHSYSQQVLYPFSYSCTDAPPSLENLEELALGLAKAIHHSSGEIYGVTSACEGSVMANQKVKKEHRLWPKIETGGGSALDWMYHDMGVKYSYQIKLRDTGSYGFLLPSKNIVPTGKEIFNAVTYFGKFLLGNKGIERSEPSKATSEGSKFKPGNTVETPLSDHEHSTSNQKADAEPMEEDLEPNLELKTV